MDYIQDKKITQDEAGRLQAPMELDLIALFKVLEMDVKEMLENNDQSPDALIDDILRLFSTEGGEVR